MTVLVGRYALVEQVGEGGMGVVWRAHDEKLERDVAIKLLRSFVADDPEQRRRFNREARTLAGLSHDHIVRVFDYVDAGELAFLVMEYVAGANLAQTTFARLPLGLGAAAAYLHPVAQSLAYAHRRDVVHRDLTPANILVERESGRVVTTDFGLARIARSAGSLTTTATGALIGTPEYWSPEQALGRECEAPADMFALGCILFLLLSGRLPFEGEDRLALGLRRAHEDAPSLRARMPDAPEEAVTLVDSLLARQPAQRPDASTTAAALAGVAGSAPSSRAPIAWTAPPTVALPNEASTVRLRRYARRRLLLAFAAATGVVIAALIVAAEHRGTTARVPDVVALPASTARARILRALPSATVAVSRVYSTRVAAGRVIGQRPLSGAQIVAANARIRLVVSKGTPFAAVPTLSPGIWPTTARATLARSGFGGRYRYTPSWTIRKGRVIELRPGTGTRLRRPTTVDIVVASGYPRSIVPDIENTDLASAQTQLVARHLRYRIVYRLSPTVASNLVLHQIPAAGASVYQGSRIRLTVSRMFHWVRVFSASGAGSSESAAFTVPARWRIRYRLGAGGFGLAFAEILWARDGQSSADGSFFARTAGALQTHVVSDGPGTYRIAVNPFAGTTWYVEVDALE